MPILQRLILTKLSTILKNETGVNDVSNFQSVTETRNANTLSIGTLDGPAIAALIAHEDTAVPQAVAKEADNIGQAIELAAQRFKNGGRLIYIGAGTSGRLGALDAIELTPTYGVPASRAFGLLAGGQKAMYVAVEGAEDSRTLAVDDLKEQQLTNTDVVIAIAASGRTPYCLGALDYANELGALTISVTCNPDNPMQAISQVAINPVVGPEVITGSTRMKAGSAQKMVLNSLSTGIMIKSGYVYENLMINVQATNEKLVNRSIGILQQVLPLSIDQAQALFETAHHNIAVGIIMHKKQLAYPAALSLFEQNHGDINQIEGIYA